MNPVMQLLKIINEIHIDPLIILSCVFKMLYFLKRGRSSKIEKMTLKYV